jgi:glycosyltransferase involved in cell wall biosynthesis
LQPSTALVHTRDWNFAKAAIKSQVPVIFECHHRHHQPFEAEFAQSPWLQTVVTVIDTVRDNILERGMPGDKVFVVPNGFNQKFLQRYPEEAKRWRHRCLAGAACTKLAVYAGALHPFKGIDLILTLPTNSRPSSLCWREGRQPSAPTIAKGCSSSAGQC